jgi:aspartyl aminopeptidase
MTLAALIALLEQLAPLAANLVEQLQAANASQLAAIETILADADKNWQEVITAANQQTGNTSAA